jgi:hypothetical protein
LTSAAEKIPKMESNQEECAARFRESPMRRPKLPGMKRNAAALLGSLAVFVFLYGTATADTIHLKNGRKLEGIVKSETDKAIELEVGFGTLKLMRADIESIERTDESGTDRLKERWAKQAEARLQAEKERQYAPKQIAAFETKKWTRSCSWIPVPRPSFYRGRKRKPPSWTWSRRSGCRQRSPTAAPSRRSR